MLPPVTNSSEFLGLEFEPYTADLARMSFGAGSNGNLRVVTNTTVSDSDAVVEGATYLVVGRLTTHSGADELVVNFYDDGDTLAGTEPLIWDVVHPFTLPESPNTLQIRGGNNTVWEFDEIRMGTTFADVTGVPEPASPALLACGGLLLARRARHR